jgi:hypothetical protein
MFSRVIYFIKKFYQCGTSSAIWKDIAAINCITVQHKKVLFSSNSSSTLVYLEEPLVTFEQLNFVLDKKWII